ncbi:MAG: TIM barrel protein, partial [Chloroflexales bacterium]|nr:TIM barrel protein [Chloroflexales bacterium]
MQLSFLTADVSDIAKAARLGFDGVELNVSALGDATAGALNRVAIDQARQLCADHGMTITALAFYDLA